MIRRRQPGSLAFLYLGAGPESALANNPDTLPAAEAIFDGIRGTLRDRIIADVMENCWPRRRRP